MVVIRCSLGFKKLKVDTIPVFAGGVQDGLYANPTVFVMPPVPLAQFTLLISTYASTLSIYKQGGKGQYGVFDTARTALFNGLETNARYVDTIALGDENIITLAGYVATKGTRSAATVPVQATGLEVTAGATGKLHVSCAKQAGAVSYGCIMTAGQPLPESFHIDSDGQLVVGNEGPKPPTPYPTPTPPAPPAPPASDPTIPPTPASGILAAMAFGGVIDFSMNRKKTFKNLTRGVTYYFYFFVINARGVGQLSLPKQGWCV